MAGAEFTAWLETWSNYSTVVASYIPRHGGTSNVPVPTVFADKSRNFKLSIKKRFYLFSWCGKDTKNVASSFYWKGFYWKGFYWKGLGEMFGSGYVAYGRGV